MKIEKKENNGNAFEVWALLLCCKAKNYSAKNLVKRVTLHKQGGNDQTIDAQKVLFLSA